MEFTRFDFALILSMSSAIIIMSFVYPALGLSNEEVQPDKIPEFNLSEDRFDIAGQYPESPGTPTKGELIHDGSLDGGGSKDNRWLDGGPEGTNNGVQISWINLGNNSHPEMNITFTNWDSDTVIFSESHRLNETESVRIQNDSYDIIFTFTLERNIGEENYYAVVSYDMETTKSTDNWFQRIPLVGDVFDTVDQVASVIAWGIAVIFWMFQWLIESGLEALFLIIDWYVFMVELLVYMVQTYYAMVSGVGSWGKLFTLIPGILLSLEFAKIAMIVISLLPTT